MYGPCRPDPQRHSVSYISSLGVSSLTYFSDFKSSRGLNKVIVLWTANTERFADHITGVNDSAENLLRAIENGHNEIAPSTVFAVASILENAPFINGSPQNTFVPGAVELAEKHGAFIGGDDFKSGQTKMKSALVDFMINAGLKLTSIASYNHLGKHFITYPSYGQVSDALHRKQRWHELKLSEAVPFQRNFQV